MVERVAVLFGTETGNSQECADRLASAIRDLGVPSESIDMGHYEPERLGRESLVFIVTSTYGNGDPPSNAKGLHDYVGLRSPQLDGLRFGVCALGDSTYPLFAQCGRDFDERLAERGAMRITDLVTCDGEFDYDEPFEEFKESCLAYVGEAWEQIASDAAGGGSNGSSPNGSSPNGSGTNGTDVRVTVAPAAFVASAEAAPGVHARLRAKRRLSGASSEKDTWHVEFDLNGAAPNYEPGDCFALAAHNDPAEVALIGEWLCQYGNEAVMLRDGSTTTLEDALIRTCCLQRIPVRLLELLAPHSSIARILRDRAELRGEFGGDHDVLDLLRTAPEASITGQDLLSALRPLAPRFYSIASSRRRHPGEVHFTIDAVRRRRAGREILGVASTYAIERLPIGSSASLTLHENEKFRLPEGDGPILMIGPGTGVAPFRAFLHERRERGATGRNWLFFGDQHRAEDFIYEDEISAMSADGLLTRLDLAFSRDQNEKIYVQTRMRENGKALYSWLEEGAVFYVCGDATRMAKDVDKALHALVAEHGGLSSDGADAYVANLKREKRYLRDVY